MGYRLGAHDSQPCWRPRSAKEASTPLLNTIFDLSHPALANEWVSRNAAWQIVSSVKKPWRHGTTHLAMSSPELERLLLERPIYGLQIHRSYVSSGSIRTG